MATRTLEPARERRRQSARNRTAWLLLAPALVYLIVTTQVPFLMTIYFSLERWNLTRPDTRAFIGLGNYQNLLTNPDNLVVLWNTLVLTFSVIAVTLTLGMLLALLLNRSFAGRGLVRTLLISSFFIMPVVTAVIWKNMIMNPVFGLLADLSRALGQNPIDWLSALPMASIVIMVSWEWVPFAMLILLTGLQSLPQEQLEAARIDGATPWGEFRYVVLPHMRRPIEVTVLLLTVFILQIFGEIFVSTSGGPGTATTTLTYFLYQKAFAEYNIGLASAAGVLAVILTNIVAGFVLRLISGNLQTPKELT